MHRLRNPLALAGVIVAASILTAVAQHEAPPATMRAAEAIAVGAGATDPGRRLYEVHCASCHGPNGEGARGPTLAQAILPRARDDSSLLQIIREGISGTEMPRSRLERPEAVALAVYVRSMGQRPVEQVPGDPKRGERIYFEKGQCNKCHSLRGEGSLYGGDLTEIGRKRSANSLRRAIIDPNAEVPQSFSPRNEAGFPENFLYVRVITRDGEDYSGVRANEDTFVISIREAPGRVRTFAKPDLTLLRKEWGKSPMPTYAGAFTNEELDDLVAFLVSLRGQHDKQ